MSSLSDAIDESDLTDFHNGSIKRKARAAQMEADRKTVLEGLQAAKKLIDEALPKFNWGASALDGNAITLLNEVPAKIAAALVIMEAQ